MDSVITIPSEKITLASLQAENASLRAELQALRGNRTPQSQSPSQSPQSDSSSVETSQFFRLPREIRDAIYELCVVPGIIFIKRPNPFPRLHGFDMRDSQRPQTKAQCQIFLVNKKLRSEALEVFVSMNQFVISACTHPIEPRIPGHREGLPLLERHLHSISVSFNSIETAPFEIARKYRNMAATARDYDGAPHDGAEFHDSPETSAHYRDITMQLMIRFSITLVQLFESRWTGQLRRIQINLEATLCPLGCHRIVRPVFHACRDRLARLFAARPNDTLVSIDFLGTVSDEERETIRMAFPDFVREKITFHGAYNRRWAVWDSMSVVHTEEMNVEAEAADLEADLIDLLVHM
jgi:hypothetical protein